MRNWQSKQGLTESGCLNTGADSSTRPCQTIESSPDVVEAVKAECWYMWMEVSDEAVMYLKR